MPRPRRKDGEEYWDEFSPGQSFNAVLRKFRAKKRIRRRKKKRKNRDTSRRRARVLRLRRHKKPRTRDKGLPMPVVTLGVWKGFDRTTGVIATQETYRNSDTAQGKGRLYHKVCRDEVHPGPPYLNGGPLDLYVAINPAYQVQGQGRSFRDIGSTRFQYDGGIVCNGFGANSPASSDLLTLGVSGRFSGAYGGVSDAEAAAAYNKARPKIEKADAAVFAGEAREIPGMFAQSARWFSETWKSMGGDMRAPFMQPKKVADEFLNQQFGWAPFLGDLVKFYDTYQNTGKYLSQIERNNGEWVRRRRRLGSTVVHGPTTRLYSPQAYPVVPSLAVSRPVDGHSCIGYTDFYSVVKTTTWFVGAFKYYLPHFDPGRPIYHTRYGQVMRYMSLYGARVSPSTVWNLLPWSWLADWVSNAGDVVDNYTATVYDNLVNKYAYVMRTTIEEYHNKSVVFMRPPATDRYGHWVFRVMAKRRHKASPFGFGLTWDGFTPRQLGILAALGISRASR